MVVGRVVLKAQQVFPVGGILVAIWGTHSSIPLVNCCLALSREIIPIKLSVISSTVNLWSLFTFACFVLCGGRMSLNCA